MKITSFDRTNLRILADEINETLKPLAAKYGITITYKGASFSAGNATIKVEAATVSNDGTVVTKERQAFIQLAGFYGLKATDIDKTFNYCGEGYTITGLASRASKAPILAVSSKNGKTYKFPIDTVKFGLTK